MLLSSERNDAEIDYVYATVELEPWGNSGSSTIMVDYTAKELGDLSIPMRSQANALRFNARGVVFGLVDCKYRIHVVDFITSM